MVGIPLEMNITMFGLILIGGILNYFPVVFFSHHLLGEIYAKKTGASRDVKTHQHQQTIMLGLYGIIEEVLMNGQWLTSDSLDNYIARAIHLVTTGDDPFDVKDPLAVSEDTMLKYLQTKAGMSIDVMREVDLNPKELQLDTESLCDTICANMFYTMEAKIAKMPLPPQVFSSFVGMLIAGVMNSVTCEYQLLSS